MVTKDQLKSTDLDEVLDWEVSKVESGLKALATTIGKGWSKGKKAYELAQAIKAMNSDEKDESAITTQDSNLIMLQMFQKIQEQMAAQTQAMQQQMAQDREKSEAQAHEMASQLASQMEAIANKVGEAPEASNAGRGNRSHAKGRHPEKIERDIDYATFLQW